MIQNPTPTWTDTVGSQCYTINIHLQRPLLSLMPPASLMSDKAFTVGDRSYYYLKYTFVTEMISFNNTILAHT